uniref:Uncharacterized protein n=1 Tax=Vitrella brassicaformis TaxID=1169539 RepID=A0A7S1JRQ6_9ALVE|mmetsp:Transcript_21350/g.52225  ORF Transcript_21350/g.52225 Transcript_21350/m.52225 type:complete len:107 (+) Transcript_21350:288-608(+)
MVQADQRERGRNRGETKTRNNETDKTERSSIAIAMYTSRERHAPQTPNGQPLFETPCLRAFPVDGAQLCHAQAIHRPSQCYAGRQKGISDKGDANPTRRNLCLSDR